MAKGMRRVIQRWDGLGIFVKWEVGGDSRFSPIFAS